MKSNRADEKIIEAIIGMDRRRLTAVFKAAAYRAAQLLAEEENRRIQEIRARK
jgi:hypothetical protein